MFWFTALNEPFPEFKERNKNYREMLKVALLSAKKNAPGLKPVHIYNGREEAFHDELRALGCEVVFHRLSFEDRILSEDTRSDDWKDIARGAFLRLDIPSLFPFLTEALYTDVDIVFLRDPTAFKLKTSTIALAPEFDRENFSAINSGSMLFHSQGIEGIFKELIKFTCSNLNIIPDYDQGAIQLFLKGRWDRLSPLMNWKPYWGFEENAVIVHYHGPKPHNFDGSELLLPTAPIYQELFSRAPSAYGSYLAVWRELKTQLPNSSNSSLKPN